jgi:hypothetical protein
MKVIILFIGINLLFLFNFCKKSIMVILQINCRHGSYLKLVTNEF